MKKVLFTLIMVAFAACNNSTETSVSDSIVCDSSQLCDTMSVDTLKNTTIVDTTAVK
jgi:uncharacterized protein YcfL